MTAVLGVIQFAKFFIIIHIFTKMISFACAFAVFLLFSGHIRMDASDYHSNLSIIPDIFRKKQRFKVLFVPHGCKTSVFLRTFVIIIKCYTVIVTLDEILVITF